MKKLLLSAGAVVGLLTWGWSTSAQAQWLVPATTVPGYAAPVYTVPAYPVYAYPAPVVPYRPYYRRPVAYRPYYGRSGLSIGLYTPGLVLGFNR